MKIYFTGVDNGDGSIGVEFFDCFEAIELLEEVDYERYRGEGGGYFEVDSLPTNITILSLEDVKLNIEKLYDNGI